MGKKSLSSSLQTIPWCLHVMGKQMRCMQQFPHADPDVDEYPPTVHSSTVKLIQDGGHVQVFYRPVPASELMVEFPKHLICHSDSLFIGQKIPALSGSDLLQLGHKYFLLPKHLFQSVLSFVTIASFMTTSSSSPSSSSSSDVDKAKAKAAFVKKAASCRPFHIQKSPSGTLQIRVSDDFILKLMEEGRMMLRSGEHRDVNLVNASKNSHHLHENKKKNKNKEDSKQQVLIPNGSVATSVLCTTPELEKDYTSLVGWKRSKDWKPKLETIKEKKEKNNNHKAKKKTMSTNKGSNSTSTIGHHDHHHPQLTKPSHGHKKNSKHEQKKQQLLHPNMSLITTTLVRGSSSSRSSSTSTTNAKDKDKDKDKAKAKAKAKGL